MTKIKIEVPGSFEELSVKQFLFLEAGNYSDLELLAVLSNQDLSELENTDVDLDPAVRKVYELLNQKPPDLEKQKKGKIVLEGKEIKFPSDLNFTRYGQKAMVKNLLRSADRIELIVSEVFAIYAQPIIDGKFDSNRIPEVKAIVDNLPIIEVFPYTVFFFSKLQILKNSLQIN